MTTALEPVALDLPALKEHYLSLSVDQRLEELESLHQRGVENAIRMAALIWSMKARGDDMTPAAKCVGDMLEVFYRLGEGTLTLNAMRRWGKRLRYLEVLKRLTPPDQERLCQGPVPVAERTPDGTFTHRMMQLDDIVESNLAPQVFDKGMIRTPTEQEVWLKRQQRREARRTAPDKIGRWTFDDALETPYLNRTAVPFAELEEVYKECKRRGYGRK